MRGYLRLVINTAFEELGNVSLSHPRGNQAGAVFERFLVNTKKRKQVFVIKVGPNEGLLA